MTMQVGIVSAQGIVLAGDTKWCQEPNGEGTRRSFNDSKINISPCGMFAVSYAGDMESAGRLSQKILEEIPFVAEKDRKDHIRKCGEQVVGDKGLQVECFIACAQESDLYLFQYGKRGLSDCKCNAVYSFTVAGDDTSAATFWPERYCGNAPTLDREDAIRVSAYAVLQGARLNTAGVGGLEIVYGDPEGFHRYTKKQNVSLIAWAKNLDATISQMILQGGGSL